MTAHRWRNSAGHLIRVDGHHVLCEACPCGCPTGSALYKIKYAERDTSCTPGAANEYRLNISCECKCLFAGTIPDPLPEGKTAADYYNSYPLSGGTSPLWKRTIAGGPFTNIEGGLTAAEQCDALQVEGCVTGCGWYAIKTNQLKCQGSTDYSCNPTCYARCLITRTIPNPIPVGKTKYDYYGSYPITEDGYRSSIVGGPYSASCTKTAQEAAMDVFAADNTCIGTEKCDGYGVITRVVTRTSSCNGNSFSYSWTAFYGGYTCNAATGPATGACKTYTYGKYSCTYQGQVECEMKWYVAEYVYSSCGGNTPPTSRSTLYLHPIQIGDYPMSGDGYSGDNCTANHLFTATLLYGPFCTEDEAQTYC